MTGPAESTVLRIEAGASGAPSETWMERLAGGFAAGGGLTLEVEAGASADAVAFHLYGLLRAYRSAAKAEHMADELLGGAADEFLGPGEKAAHARGAVAGLIRLDNRAWRHLVACARPGCVLRQVAERVMDKRSCVGFIK